MNDTATPTWTHPFDRDGFDAFAETAGVRADRKFACPDCADGRVEFAPDGPDVLQASCPDCNAPPRRYHRTRGWVDVYGDARDGAARQLKLEGRTWGHGAKAEAPPPVPPPAEPARSPAPPAGTCPVHPDREAGPNGLCNACAVSWGRSGRPPLEQFIEQRKLNRRGVPKPPCIVHPDKPSVARRLCAGCYSAWLSAGKPSDVKQFARDRRATKKPPCTTQPTPNAPSSIDTPTPAAAPPPSPSPTGSSPGGTQRSASPPDRGSAEATAPTPPGPTPPAGSSRTRTHESTSTDERPGPAERTPPPEAEVAPESPAPAEPATTRERERPAQQKHDQSRTAKVTKPGTAEISGRRSLSRAAVRAMELLTERLDREMQQRKHILRAAAGGEPVRVFNKSEGLTGLVQEVVLSRPVDRLRFGRIGRYLVITDTDGRVLYQVDGGGS